MTTIPHVARTIRTLLTVTAETLAWQTGCVQRRSKLTGAGLVQTLVLGWLAEPAATLQQVDPVGRAVGYHHYAPGAAPLATLSGGAGAGRHHDHLAGGPGVPLAREPRDGPRAPPPGPRARGRLVPGRLGVFLSGGPAHPGPARRMLSLPLAGADGRLPGDWGAGGPRRLVAPATPGVAGVPHPDRLPPPAAGPLDCRAGARGGRGHAAPAVEASRAPPGPHRQPGAVAVGRLDDPDHQCAPRTS